MDGQSVADLRFYDLLVKISKNVLRLCLSNLSAQYSRSKTVWNMFSDKYILREGLFLFYDMGGIIYKAYRQVLLFLKVNIWLVRYRRNSVKKSCAL